ncbi:N-terminal 7TM region of histidine kinase [Lachnospiraceae bacterium NE2001]|nr:N-terminal 7TM region of histidine kinase [Lachnospiraceae bacterium NE2001]
MIKMCKKGQNYVQWGQSPLHMFLFVGLLVLGGLLHIIEHSIHDISALGDQHYAIVTLFFCMEFVIYTVLIIFWIQSVYTRLLPSRARSYMVVVALFMILYLILRAYKYRIAGHDMGLRLSWYAYYIPMTFIPALFLMVCIQIKRGAAAPRLDERLLLIPAAVLSGIIISNDIHHLVFVPEPGLDNFIGKSGTYTYRITFYLTYAWIVIAILASLILLIKTFGLRQKRRLMYLGGILAIWLILTQLHTLKKIIEFTPPYESPEIYIFTVLAIFEFAIRERLIPYNENYAGFFESLPMTVMITDKSFSPVYQSAVSLELEPNVLANALDAPVYPIPDGKLSGKMIRGGYTFWIEDESDIRHANEELNEANELLEGENTLIEYENKQKEENAYLRLHHHIYHEIAQEMYPYQKRIEGLLNEAVPGSKEFKDIVAEVSVLNAFVKRKTNMLLMASEHDTISVNELLLAVSESGRYLEYVGIKASVDESGISVDYPSDTIIAIYDTFQMLIEQLIGHISMLLISYSEEGLRLAIDTSIKLNTENAPLPVSIEQQDDILLITIKVIPIETCHKRVNAAEKGGE